MRQRHRFVSHSPYCPVVRLNGPRACIRTPLYLHLKPGWISVHVCYWNAASYLTLKALCTKGCSLRCYPCIIKVIFTNSGSSLPRRVHSTRLYLLHNFLFTLRIRWSVEAMSSSYQQPCFFIDRTCRDSTLSTSASWRFFTPIIVHLNKSKVTARSHAHCSPTKRREYIVA